MTILKFKTNIKCGGCIAKVTPELNKAAGPQEWKVDLNHPDKILSVENDQVSEKELVIAIEKAGFKAERLQ